MKNRYFKSFNHLFGQARKSTAQTLKEPLNEIRGRAPGQLHSLFAEVVEYEKIAGANRCRERHHPADVTFLGMLGEVFRGGSLRDAAHRRVCEKMMPSGGILDGRPVMVVDATSGQLEDTACNQQ